MAAVDITLVGTERWCIIFDNSGLAQAIYIFDGRITSTSYVSRLFDMSATSPAPPSWFKTFYSYFPLLTLPQEDPLPVDHQSALWV